MSKYTIKEISQISQLPASTIRYYEEIGLLENVVHIDRYHREYSDEHVNRLASIQCFKKGRMSLDDIRKFYEYEEDMEHNAENIIELMKAREADTLAEIEAMQSGLEHIQKKITYYTAITEALKNNTPFPSWNELFNE